MTLLSLLGTKLGGKSEWSFYSFFETGGSLQQWLNQNMMRRKIHVIEHPTIDTKLIAKECLLAIEQDLLALLKKGVCVVMFDSGGVQRIGAVCKFVGAQELDD